MMWEETPIFFTRLLLLVQVILLADALRCSSDDNCLCTKLKNNTIIANCCKKGLSTLPKFIDNVTFVNLSDNSLTTFPINYTFPKGIRVLDLSKNKFNNLNNNPFASLHNLIALDLSGNRLKMNSLHKGIFRDLRMLKRLNLKGLVHINEKKVINYPGPALSDLTNLEELRLDGIEGAKFGPEFRLLRKLAVIDLSGDKDKIKITCRIYTLTRSFFVNLPYVEKVDLSGCNITAIENGSIRLLPFLHHLDLSYNQFLSFRVLANLTYDLQYTKIKVLRLLDIHCTSGVGTIIFKDHVKYLSNTSIEEVYLSKNRLELVEKGAIEFFPKSLSVIDVSKNSLQAGLYLFDILKTNVTAIKSSYQRTYGPTGVSRLLNCYDWRGPRRNMMRRTMLEELTEFNFFQRKIKYFSNQHLSTNQNIFPYIKLPPNLKGIKAADVHLDLFVYKLIFHKENNLQSVDLRKTFVHGWMGPVKNLHRLRRLDLSQNDCKQLSHDFFDDFPSLQRLNISDNYVGRILSDDEEGKIFKSLNKLTILDISKNGIGDIPARLFQGLRSIEKLYVNSNTLFQWNAEIGHMKNLTYLGLLNNRIQFLKPFTMKEVNTISKSSSLSIDLRNNSLLCSCDTLQFLRWMSQRKQMFRGLHEYTCRHNHNLVLFSNLDKVIEDLDRNCSNYLGLIIGILVVIVSSFTLVIMGIIYRYRWRLRYIYYVTKSKLRTRAGVGTEHQYRYDAFVSYSDENRNFVINDVIDNLETRFGHRLCLHNRDFIPGRDISENITTAVHESNRTMVILTREYLRSYWCMFEFNMARMESVHSRNGDRVLFIVMLEHIDHGEIPLMMMDIIESDSYVEYPNDDVGNVVFWDKIKTAISL